MASLRIERHEWRAAVLAFAYFFLLLASSAVLRPVRDAMGIASGVKQLPWLFTGTFVTTLAIAPLYAWLTRRMPRRRFIPVVYRIIAAQTLVFFVLLSRRTGVVATASAFYVWSSVYNVFVVSVFWSFLADVFRAEQAKRLYGYIAAGGTLGTIFGPTLTVWMAGALGAASMLLVTAAMLELAVWCALALDRWHRAQPVEANAADAATAPTTAAKDAPVAGSLLQGFWLVVRSPLLAGISVHVLLYSLTSTVLYIEQQKLVAAAAHGTDQHTVIFAQMDQWTQLATLALQLFVTAPVLRGLGVAAALATLPFITALGSGVLAAHATLPVMAVFQALRRSSQYALERPGRETIFTTTTREVRYRSKNFIDTVVVRGGDMLTAWANTGLTSLGLGFVSLAAALVPLSLGWAVLATWIGRGGAWRARKQQPAD
jgi:AAA family ATP:ADP antiporter